MSGKSGTTGVVRRRCVFDFGRAFLLMEARRRRDGTPQIVTRNSNPSLHRILTEYEQLSGLPVLINTSYNMHEEPIVCSPTDAVRGFQRGHLDVLAMGPYLVVQDP